VKPVGKTVPPAPDLKAPRFLALAAATLTLLLGACAPLLAPPPPPVPPQLEGELLQQLEENGRAFRSLQGLARVRIKSPERSLTTTQVIFAEKPDRFRAETLSPFGTPLLMMATDGSELTVLIPSDRKFYRGEASPANLQRLTRLPLQMEDLVGIILYQTPMIPYRRSALSPVAEGGYLLELSGDKEVRQQLFFDPELRLVQVAYWAGEALQLRIRYDKFAGEVRPFPRETFLEMPARQVEARIDFSEASTNVAIPGERFVLTPPDGVSVSPIP
jgi:outer membrane lipoprotein-sorting protein